MIKNSRGSVITIANIFMVLGSCALMLLVPIALSAKPPEEDPAIAKRFLLSLFLLGIGFLISGASLYTKKKVARYVAIIFSAIAAVNLLLSVRVIFTTSKNLSRAIDNSIIPFGIAVFLLFAVYYLIRPNIKSQFKDE